MFAGIMPFSRASVAALKSRIRKAFPKYKSGHVDEALAFAFGFRTHAAMLVALEQLDGSSHLHARADHTWFVLRLQELGYSGFDLIQVQSLFWSADLPPHPELVERNERIRGLFSPRPANDQ